MGPTPIKFYIDPISPYAWLAIEQIDKIVEAGASIECRPVLLAALLNANATKGPAEVPAKRVYVFRDVMRQAKRLQLSFRGPPSHPFNPLPALRTIQAVESGAQRLVLARELCRAAWSEGIDIADVSAVRAVVERSGLDTDAIITASATPEIKQRLRSTTQEAIDVGVFGVPTFSLSGELFWGADRIDSVIWKLQGGGIDDALYAEALNRPASASR